MLTENEEKELIERYNKSFKIDKHKYEKIWISYLKSFENDFMQKLIYQFENNEMLFETFDKNMTEYIGVVIPDRRVSPNKFQIALNRYVKGEIKFEEFKQKYNDNNIIYPKKERNYTKNTSVSDLFHLCAFTRVNILNTISIFFNKEYTNDKYSYIWCSPKSYKDIIYHFNHYPFLATEYIPGFIWLIPTLLEDIEKIKNNQNKENDIFIKEFINNNLSLRNLMTKINPSHNIIGNVDHTINCEIMDIILHDEHPNWLYELKSEINFI